MFLLSCVILFMEGGLSWEGLPPGGSAPRGSASGERGSWSDPLRYMRYYGIQSTSGRYASYWNAFLFLIKILSIPMYGPLYPKMLTLLLLLSVYQGKHLHLGNPYFSLMLQW